MKYTVSESNLYMRISSQWCYNMLQVQPLKIDQQGFSFGIAYAPRSCTSGKSRQKGRAISSAWIDRMGSIEN